jgi:hypothetical protein
MTPAHVSPIAMSAGLFLLVGWRMYYRLRRLIGRQPYHPRRPWFSVTLFPLLVALVLWAVRAHSPAVAALLAGLPIGIALGVLGLRLTRFEVTPQGLFYTPNAHLGIALSLLMVGRLAYRFLTLHLGENWLQAFAMQAAPSPLTLLIFGLLAGYYPCYAAGLLRWRYRAMANTATAQAPPLAEIPAMVISPRSSP